MTFTQRGYARLGYKWPFQIKASWPLGSITITDTSLTLNCLIAKKTIPLHNIC